MWVGVHGGEVGAPERFRMGRNCKWSTVCSCSYSVSYVLVFVVLMRAVSSQQKEQIASLGAKVEGTFHRGGIYTTSEEVALKISSNFIVLSNYYGAHARSVPNAIWV